MVDSSHEYRHASGAEDAWAESWYFDVVGPDADWALHTRLALYPNRRLASWWAVLARRHEPLLLVRDESLALPNGAALEARGSGLWVDVHCHEPLQRWQVNFEGIALALEPSDVGVGEVGDRVPVEFEFEWEATAPAVARPGGYVQPCVVDGEVAIEAAGLGLSLVRPVPGWRGHSWGVSS